MGEPRHRIIEPERHLAELRRLDARQVVISWAGSGGFAAVHAAGGTVENITDDLLAYLWRAGFKIAPLSDGDWF